MKKILTLFLCVIMMCGTVAYAAAPSPVVTNAEYEVWTQSPKITCGITSDDMMIYKALEQNLLQLYPLSKVGDRYYLGICTEKVTDGGWSGKTKTSYHNFFILYATEDGFIILGKSSASEEYYWDRGFSFVDITDKINTKYYVDNKSERPCYILNPQGKYTNSNYDEYDEYWFITDKGNIYRMSSNAEYGCEGYPYVKDGILYRGQNAYRSSSSTRYYYMPDGTTKASNSTPMFFNSGSLTQGAAIRVAISEMTTANGYSMYTEGFSSNVSVPNYMQISGSDNYFFTTTNVQRYNSTDSRNYYHIVLNIYKSDGTFMNLVKSVDIPTKSTYNQTYTYQSLTGLDTAYYTGKGLPVPAVAIGNKAIIMTDGSAYALNLNTSKYGNDSYISAYNNKLAITRSTTNGSYIYHQDPTNNNYYYYWQAINEILIDSSGNVSLTPDMELRIQSSAHPGQNGYFSSYSNWNQPSFTAISTASVKSWWGRTLNNVFPDGRYVTASWMGMGSNLSELWYNIYNPDGSLRATGPTGYSTYFSSSFDRYPLIAYAVNNSKFLVCLGDIGSSFLKEYYRYAVLEESDTGEISTKVQLGDKTITPPDSSDTEVVQEKINFGESELPIGYNIKNNVIDSGKLDVALREQVNTIKLNDIVILKNGKYQSGSQNTGTSLSYLSNYEYSLGNTYIRFYTNGQNVNWYCNSPNSLNVGTYNKSYTVGDKKIYVTIKVIQPPTNEGSTTVVF